VTSSKVAIPKNARTLNWTNAAVRFQDASVIETRESFDTAAQQKVIVQVVKTRSKYPHIRVETPFVFDPEAQAWVPQPPVEYVADQVLVQLKSGVTQSQLSKALEKVEGRVVQRHFAEGSTLVLIGLPTPTPDAVPKAIERLAKFRDVFEVVEPHCIRRASATPNDPRFYEQWALQNISAPAAWDLSVGGGSVVVAVLDTGIDYNHPELSARVWTNPAETPGNGIDDDYNGLIDDYRGYNFAYENSNPYDDESHGTFVSGLIGAVGNNGVGIAGICWNVRIMPVKIIDSYGALYNFDLIRGYDYARSKGAKIINASFGGAYSSSSEYNAISRLRSAGVLLVAAAGNDHNNNDMRPMYPASYAFDNIIATTYTDSNDLLSPNGNYGIKSVDLAAPGVLVLSTEPGATYNIASGSSFAAPQVVGVAALLKALYPTRSYSWIRSTIMSNVDRRPALIGRTVTGGRLNAYEALIPRVPLPDALESGALVWVTGGSRPWSGQTLDSSDGIDSARCGNINDSQSSWLQTTVTGPGRLSFFWRSSSEYTFDRLEFSVNGQVQTDISGEQPWEQREFLLLSRTNYTLRWNYVKDETVSEGTDKAWLDQVTYVRDTAGPAITITAPSGTNLYATDVLLQGTCSDVFGVAALECRLVNSNGTGPWLAVDTSDGYATWQVQLSNLALRTNRVIFRGVDTLNQTSAVSRTYMVLSPLTVNVAGCGTVDAKYTGLTWQEAGRTLSVRATPCAGHLFTHWSGDRTSSNAVLTFVMQPSITLQANFVVNLFPPVAGTYNGLFHEAAGVLHESSGLVKLTLNSTGAFTGSIVCDGVTNAFSSRFDPGTGLSSFAVPRVGKSALQIALQLDFNDQVAGQIANGVWTADLIADRLVFNPTNNPAPFAGMYTLVFPGDLDFTNSPGGHGFATATVNARGQVSIDGKSGDGNRVLQTIGVSKNGDWPFYMPLYSGTSKGSTLGWLKFLSPPGLTNQLTSWIRPYNGAAIYYRNGFSNEISALGSTYSVPTTNRVIDCTNALLTLSGADFLEPLTNQMVLTASNTVLNGGPHNISMSIVRTNGTFTGRLVLPKRTNTFQGIFLREQNIGLGYFIGSNYIGEVRFEPATP
jgi:subtilisin family serine protease